MPVRVGAALAAGRLTVRFVDATGTAGVLVRGAALVAGMGRAGMNGAGRWAPAARAGFARPARASTKPRANRPTADRKRRINIVLGANP